MRTARLLSAFVAFGIALVSVPGCESEFGDTPSRTFVPKPEGNDKRIRQIADPASPDRVAHGAAVAVSGAVVVAVDSFDETRDGRSMGSIYVADMGSQEPYSGISLFNPSWIPGNLRVGAGDALDLRGTFQENNSIPLQFAPDAYLVQIANPIGTFRYEASVPPTTEIDITELENYETGRAYLNMLVTVKDVEVGQDLTAPTGRASATLTPQEFFPKCADPFPKSPTIVNELMDLAPLNITKGTKLKSLTGVVTFFCNLHIAPRSADDIVIDK